MPQACWTKSLNSYDQRSVFFALEITRGSSKQPVIGKLHIAQSCRKWFETNEWMPVKRTQRKVWRLGQTGPRNAHLWSLNRLQPQQKGMPVQSGPGPSARALGRDIWGPLLQPLSGRTRQSTATAAGTSAKGNKWLWVYFCQCRWGMLWYNGATTTTIQAE